MRFIGAELATHALLKHLQSKGWAVRVLTFQPPPSGVTAYDGVPLFPLQQITGSPPTLLAGGYPSDQDDLLLTHLYAGPDVIRPLLDARGRNSTPIAVYAHHYRPHARTALAALRPDHIIPNSRATALKLDLPSDTAVRPPLELPDPDALLQRITDAPRPPVAGYVNSAPIKGGALLLELSNITRRPYELHGLDGGYGEQLLPAHQPVPHADMPAAYYQQIGVHLQLSTSESWGSTALEALSHGIPVISTDLPGPREALHKFPKRFVHWMPAAPSPDYSAAYLDLLIRYVLALPVPAARECATLAAALTRTAAASAADRERAEKRLRALVGG